MNNIEFKECNLEKEYKNNIITFTQIKENEETKLVIKGKSKGFVGFCCKIVDKYYVKINNEVIKKTKYFNMNEEITIECISKKKNKFILTNLSYVSKDEFDNFNFKGYLKLNSDLLENKENKPWGTDKELWDHWCRYGKNQGRQYIEPVQLNKVCEFKNGNTIKKDKIVKGEYPILNSDKKPLGEHNEFNREENTILCSSKCIQQLSTKVWAGDCFSIHSKDNNILNETYLYYYLLFNQFDIFALQNKKNVYTKELEKFLILIPNIKKQMKITKFIHKLFDKKYNLENVIEYYKESDIFKLLINDKYDIFEKLVEWHFLNSSNSDRVNIYNLLSTA